jgi:hypothetical protein
MDPESPTISGTSSSPPFRGEREGPRRGVSRKPSGLTRGGGEGEVGGTADRPIGPPHPSLSPRPAVGEG